jgi:hypothetical protein
MALAVSVACFFPDPLGLRHLIEPLAAKDLDAYGLPR